MFICQPAQFRAKLYIYLNSGSDLAPLACIDKGPFLTDKQCLKFLCTVILL